MRFLSGVRKFAPELLAREGPGLISLFREGGLLSKEGVYLLFGMGKDLIGGFGAGDDFPLDADRLGGLGN